MLRILVGLAFMASVSAFAGAKDCLRLGGKYSCVMKDQVLAMNLQVRAPLNRISVRLGTDGDDFVVDGKLRKSLQENSKNEAVCEENVLKIKNYYQDKLKANATIYLEEGKLKYKLEQGETKIEMVCTKK